MKLFSCKVLFPKWHLLRTELPKFIGIQITYLLTQQPLSKELFHIYRLMLRESRNTCYYR